MQPDPVVALPTRPWTDGPLRVIDATDWRELVTPDDRCVAMIDGAAPEDEQLYALAPEMAEAILAWADETDYTPSEVPNLSPTRLALWMAAQNLRAIGGSHE